MFQETQSTVAVPKGQHAEVIARLSRGLAPFVPMEPGKK
jgi:hypothetical protein